MDNARTTNLFLCFVRTLRFSFSCFSEPSPQQKLDHLTASDPHAGIVALQHLPHHCESFRIQLHRTVDPHQSLQVECILENLTFVTSTRRLLPPLKVSSTDKLI